jgi:predicted oxidoreductase (fatty acid repression mutant protein)
VFLSHSGVDTEAVRELKRRILASPDAGEAGLTVWFDKDDLEAGRGWQEQIEVAITREATAFVVYVGSRGVMNWVEREVRLGLARATGAGAIPFIPILARASSADLPPFARQHQGVVDPLNNPDECAKLMRAILGKDRTEPARIIDDPFVGLRAMTEREADRFFGRQAEVAELIEDLRHNRLVAIVADSGAGKSSLAMAGLAPAFRGGMLAEPSRRDADDQVWHVVVMRPGGDPLEGLRRGVTEAAERMGLKPNERADLRRRLALDDVSEAAYALRCDLSADRTETLLIVDQFDELLTETPATARQPFIDFLLKLVRLPSPGGFYVVLTVRVDYFNLIRPFSALYDELQANNRVLRLKRISDAGLEEAVRRPLTMAGFADESEQKALADQTRRDLGDRAGDLALAQMALWTVGRNRRAYGGSLLKAYVEVGGVSGALAQEAERIREEKLTAAEREALPGLFVRLVRLGETGGALRRIADKDEFDEPRRRLAENLATDDYGRLLMVGEGAQAERAKVEVCHEALITQWPWLQNTLNAAAADLRALERLMDRAGRWDNAAPSERDKHLATGAERELFGDLAARRDAWLSVKEREFVGASGQAFADEETAKRQGALRLRALASVLGVAVVALALLVGLAFHYANNATMREEEANEAVKAVTRAQSIASAALEETKRSQEHLLHALAESRRDQAATLTALSNASRSASPALAAKLALAAWPRKGSDSGPKLDVTLDALSAAVTELRERKILRGHDGEVFSAAFSPDGARIVTVSNDDTARVWDAATGNAIAVLSGHGRSVRNAAFSPDGARVVTVSGDNTAQVWDAAAGSAIAVLGGHVGQVSSAAFSPDGARFVTVSDDKTARVWDAATGKEIAVLRGHEGPVYSAAFSPDGARIVTAGWDRTARIWDAATGKEIAVLRGHDDWVRSATFSPDGARIVTVSNDNTARIWDAATGEAIAVLSGHGRSVRNAAFSPDGAVSSQSRMTIWPRFGTLRPALRSPSSAVMTTGSRAPPSRRTACASSRSQMITQHGFGTQRPAGRSPFSTAMTARS